MMLLSAKRCAARARRRVLFGSLKLADVQVSGAHATVDVSNRITAGDRGVAIQLLTLDDSECVALHMNSADARVLVALVALALERASETTEPIQLEPDALELIGARSR